LHGSCSALFLFRRNSAGADILTPYRKKSHYALITLAGIFLIFFTDYVGLFEGINAYIYDLSFRIRGSCRPSENIIIAAIDEKTLGQLGRWPIRRNHYAPLLERMHQSSVIGFDVIFAERTEDDALLAGAIRKQGKVILPVYFDRGLNRIEPLPSLSPSMTGHIHIEQGVDNVVREVFHTLYLQDVSLPSLTSAMYEKVTKTAMKRQKPHAKSPEQTAAATVLQADPMKINYYGRPGTFQQVSVLDIIHGEYPPTFFNDKIVLIGLTAPGIVDMVSTPFSQHRNQMSGVEVHATILNNLFDGNAIHDVPEWIRWLFALLLSLLCFFLYIRFSEKKAALLWMLSLVMITVIVFTLFSLFQRWMGPALFYCSFSFVYLLTYLFRLDEAARKLDMKYLAVTNLLGGTAEAPPLLTYDRGVVGLLSSGGINTKIQRLIWVEHQYERKLEDTVSEKTQELSQALAMINTMNNEMIMRLTAAAESKDDHTGKHISRIGIYAGKVAEVLSMPSDFIENVTLASAMHDIGKIGIPDQILMKPGELSYEEFEIIKKHTTIGARILSGSVHPMIQMSSIIALYHHERWDGAGYPKGLKGSDIPVEARIIMICDIYDALRSKRPYKQPFDHKQAITIITEGDVKTTPDYFDPDVLRAFIQISPIFEEIFSKYHD
jgi:HD-GYP domain-containing protein (c-di-GMP phosphodiesterase class II)/CHASE2 domain-containing sensor protein